MAVSVNDLIAEIDAETRAILRTEPEEFRLLRTGGLPHQPGCEGQYFTALDIAAGMARDFAMYTVFPALNLARRRLADVNIATIVDEMFPVYLNYLKYSGFSVLHRLGHELGAALRGASAEDTDRLLSAYLRYVNQLYAWVFHYFPWKIGAALRYQGDTAEDGAESPPADVPALRPTATRVRLRWEPVGITVTAWLAVDHNTELCNDLLAALPFTCLQTHSMVAGESLMAFTPLVTTAPTPLREEIRRAPVGRLRFSMRTGQKLIVQYGRTTEDILGPVLGAVIDEDVHLLPTLGRAVWRSGYETKEPIWLSVSRT